MKITEFVIILLLNRWILFCCPSWFCWLFFFFNSFSWLFRFRFCPSLCLCGHFDFQFSFDFLICFISSTFRRWLLIRPSCWLITRPLIPDLKPLIESPCYLFIIDYHFFLSFVFLFYFLLGLFLVLFGCWKTHHFRWVFNF